MKPKGADAVEVHLTDEQGVITARDNYQSQRNTIKCTSMERLSNDKKMISFSEDEINILYQFGEGGKDGTLAMLNQIMTENLFQHTLWEWKVLQPSTINCFYEFEIFHCKSNAC